MLEKPIEPETVPQIRTDVTNKTAFVQKRSDIIFHDTLSGHWEVGRGCARKGVASSLLVIAPMGV